MMTLNIEADSNIKNANEISTGGLWISLPLWPIETRDIIAMVTTPIPPTAKAWSAKNLAIPKK